MHTERTASHSAKLVLVILPALFNMWCRLKWVSVSVVPMSKVQPVISANLCSGTSLLTLLMDAPAVNAMLLVL